MKAQQLRMDRWRYEFNHERPHESIDQRFPSELYQKSRRRLDEQIKISMYDPKERTLKVSDSGGIEIKGKRYHVGEAFASQRVALDHEGEDTVVRYANIKIGLLPKNPDDRLRPYPYTKRWENK